MEATLKRLLEAEQKAEKMVVEAEKAREQRIQAALEQARQNEQNFSQTLSTIHAKHTDKAKIHAQQTIAELEKRYAQCHEDLQTLADDNHGNALHAALSLIKQGAQ